MQTKTIVYSKVVSLSHLIAPDIPLWPGDPPVVFRNESTLERDGFFLRRFAMGEHSGTHINAPRTFFQDGPSIDECAPEALVAPGVVMNATESCQDNADYQLTVQDVLEWEKVHGRIPKGTLVILFTGWQDKWEQEDAFLNPDREGKLHFPGFGFPAARLLLEDRGAAGLGTDTHGIDPGTDASCSINRLALQTRRMVLECLANLHLLPPKGSTLVIGPLRLSGGSGSPAAVLALVP